MLQEGEAARRAAPVSDAVVNLRTAAAVLLSPFMGVPRKGNEAYWYGRGRLLRTGTCPPGPCATATAVCNTDTGARYIGAQLEWRLISPAIYSST